MNQSLIPEYASLPGNTGSTWRSSSSRCFHSTRVLWAVTLLQTVLRAAVGVGSSALVSVTAGSAPVSESAVPVPVSTLNWVGSSSPWGHRLNATGRSVDMEAPSDRMEILVKHDTGWVWSPSEDEKAIQSWAKLSKGTGPVPAVWQLIQVSCAAWGSTNIAICFFGSDWWGHGPGPQCGEYGIDGGIVCPRAWHEGMCTCLREHGLLGTFGGLSWVGKPNLCVHTLRTLHQTSWVGLRRVEALSERGGGHMRVQTCAVSPNCHPIARADVSTATASLPVLPHSWGTLAQANASAVKTEL